MPVKIPGGIVIHSEDTCVWVEDNALHIGRNGDMPDGDGGWENEIETSFEEMDITVEEIVEELDE